MNNIGLKKVILSLTEACNFKCGYCFPGHGNCGNHLPKADKRKIITDLAASGCREITFIGGEPTLCTELCSLIKLAKKLGMKTKIVTNGTRLTDSFLSEMKNYLDCITVSVDSVNEQTLEAIGRQCRDMVIDHNFYRNLIADIHSHCYELRINTVVNSKNLNEDLTPFINYAIPAKWKIFQVVSVDGNSSEFTVSHRDFVEFCAFHKKKTTPAIPIFTASAEFTKGSCSMIDHHGRFFDIANGMYNYSAPISDVGVENAFSQVVVHEAKVLRKMRQVA